MSNTFLATVRGRTIEFVDDLGLADGQSVRVTVEAVDHSRPWGEGIALSAGILADWDELDDVFAQIQRERHAGVPRAE